MKNILVLIICGIAGTMWAQNITPIVWNTNFTHYDTRLTNQQKKEVTSAARDLVSKYMYCADFRESDGSMSSDKYLMYKSLFTNDSKVMAYWMKSPIEEAMYLYTDRVWERLSKHGGLDYKLNEAQLDSVNINASGDYVVKCRIVKDVYTQAEGKNKIKTLVKPYRVNLYGTMILEKGALDRGTFSRMSGKVSKRVFSDVQSYVGANINYGIGNLSTSDAQYGFTDVTPKTSSFGVGAYYLRSFGRSPIYGWLEGRVQSLSIATDYTGKYSSQDNATAGKLDTVRVTVYDDVQESRQSLVRITSISGGKEDINQAILIHGILGVGYKMNIGLENFLMLKAGVGVTSLRNVSKGKRSSNIEGVEIPTAVNFPSREELESNGVLSFYQFSSTDGSSFNQDVVTASSNTSFSIVLAPTYSIPMGFNWGIDIGAQYHMGITDLMKNTPVEKSFLARDNESVSVIENYFGKSKHQQFIIHLGVHINL